MPPYVTAKCPRCQKSNQFDLVQLKTTNIIVFRKAGRHGVGEGEEEFSVTCQDCGRKFKFTMKGGKSGEEN